MDTRLFEHKLPKHKIFEVLKSSLNENPSGKLRNLLELRDDVLYVWNPSENCLLSLNLKQLEENGEETPYQKLHFLTPPCFIVDRIMISVCGSRICAWGTRGVVVAELPSRWGRGGLFDSGNQTVLCKSYSLSERLLYAHGEIRRVHWHPSSLSHLLALRSDNNIRLYNIALKTGPKLVRMLNIGPKPCSVLAGRSLLDSLGGTAVDFTPIPDTDSLLILRGNGDVYMVQCELEVKSPLQPRIAGPLAMYPPADDNYGSESCSIALVGGGGDVPPLVVVATCSAALYHCLLLPNPSEKEDCDTHALYVVETVEINMLLNSDDDDMQYSYPVHLYPCTNNTYACIHAGGVHSITLPMLGYLMDYVLADEGEIEPVLSAMCSRPSVARHLVCTSGSTGAFSPPVGVALSSPPLPTLLVLCGDCQLLARTLEPYDLEEQLYKELQLKNPALEQDDISNILKERQKLTFTSIMQEILTRDVSQPILNISKKEEPSPKQCLELVSQATLKLRVQYMCRQQRAAAAAARKLAALAALAHSQRGWLHDLKNDLDEVRLQSEVLREKCLLAEKHQEDFSYRCSTVIRKLRALAAVSPAERALTAELQHHRRLGDSLADQIRLLQRHAQRKADEMSKWHEEYKKKEIALGKSHSDTISSILQQQTSQISALIEDTKLLKDQLSIV